MALQWRHNERDDVSNHRRLDCLLNRFFRRKSKKTSKFTSLAFVWGIHRWPVNSPHKGSATRKINVSIWWRHHGGINRSPVDSPKMASNAEQKNEVTVIQQLLFWHKHHIWSKRLPSRALQNSTHIMTSSKGSFLRITSPLRGVFTGHRWTPLTLGQ